VDQLAGDTLEYRVPYAGLHLLQHTGGKYFLLPEGWRPGSSPLVVSRTTVRPTSTPPAPGSPRDERVPVRPVEDGERGHRRRALPDLVDPRSSVSGTLAHAATGCLDADRRQASTFPAVDAQQRGTARSGVRATPRTL
jgi:hypothetical protein